jgi:hypothetical protein
LIGETNIPDPTFPLVYGILTYRLPPGSLTDGTIQNKGHDCEPTQSLIGSRRFIDTLMVLIEVFHSSVPIVFIKISCHFVNREEEFPAIAGF